MYDFKQYFGHTGLRSKQGITVTLASKVAFECKTPICVALKEERKWPGKVREVDSAASNLLSAVESAVHYF